MPLEAARQAVAVRLVVVPEWDGDGCWWIDTGQRRRC
jgi:hypothetical protein